MSRAKGSKKATQRRVSLQPVPPGEYKGSVTGVRKRKGTVEILMDLTQPAAATANSRQVDGEHYKLQNILIEPWDYSMANQLDGMQYNIIKYVTRWPDKGGVKDLKKVVHYLEKYIELLEAGIPLPTNPHADTEKYKKYLAERILKKS